jgi:hypothetical protein
MKTGLVILTGFLSISAITNVAAQDSVKLEGTEIIGNKELPQVLYIVPWKPIENFEISSPKVSSIMDKKAGPIDRAAFKRKVNYHNAIYADSKPSS